MSIYNDLKEKKTKLAAVGLGYIGMPIAVAFLKKVGVIGFDTNTAKIDLYQQEVDPAYEVSGSAIATATVHR